MIEIEGFLENFKELEGFYKIADYKDEINPIDGVVYPHICQDIPERITNDVIYNLTHKALGRSPANPFIFIRKSPKGVPVPHKFHTDNSMGKYSLMLYLQDNDQGGTGLAYHKGMKTKSAPESDDELSLAIKDCNDDSKWVLYKIAKMAKNKGVIFDSSLFHVALPVGGFGKEQNARTVLTCFFS